MSKIKVVKFKKLFDDAFMPNKANSSDAGFDIRAHSFWIWNERTSELDSLGNGGGVTLFPGQRVLVKTGLSMALPFGCEAQIRPRSGMALKHGITVVNSPGTIDAGFRGEVGIILLNTSKTPLDIAKGDRVAQMVIQKLPEVVITEVDSLDGSDRGLGGFGSTGKA